MMRKELYLSPQTDALELGYAEPVCITASSGEIPNYDWNPLDPDVLFDDIS